MSAGSDPYSILPSLPAGAEILVIRLRSLGDMVLLTPALAAVHSWRPDLRLHVLVEPAFAPVLEGNPAVAGVIVHESFARTALELRRRRFAAAFNQHGGPTSALLAAAAFSRYRVCWPGKQFGFIYNVIAPEPAAFYGRSDFHTVEERLVPFYHAGLPRGPIPPSKVYPCEEAAASVRRKLGEAGLARGADYAVLHPFANYDTKVWPARRFASAARWLKTAGGLASVAVIGPGDGRLAGTVRREMSGAAVFMDSLDLRELIALMAGARLFLGNDSGPAHVAAAAGVPSVVIFGSSNASRWRPWGVRYRVVRSDLPCIPCPGSECRSFPEPRCIVSVTEEQVRDACGSLLGETAAAAREGERR